MNIRNISLVIIATVAVVLFLESCKELDSVTPFDSNAQFEKDSIAMADYITRKGLDPAILDTTSQKVIYAVLSKGDRDTLELDDIVSFDFNIVNTANDTVLVTSIKSVALQYDLLDTIETEDLAPVKFTLAGSSWTVPAIFGNSDPRDAPFQNIMAKTLAQNMRVGGRVLMIYPSYSYLLGQQNSSQILATEIFVVGVRKHAD